MRRWRPAALPWAGVLAMAACGSPAPVDSAQGPSARSAEEAGYVAPPALSAASRQGGRLRLSGVAPARSRVELAAPDGRAYAAIADAAGAWSLDLPAPTTPVMFAFSARDGDRVIRGEGAVLLPPDPAPPALLLRPGAGALSLGGGDGPVIIAVDYDAGGGAAVAGLAPANTPVRLSLDGAAAGVGQTDPQGRFAVMAANRTLARGARTIEVETAAGTVQVRLAVSPPAPLQGAAYRAARHEGNWRIDWAPPGGGVQTSIVFDGSEPSP